MHVVRRYFGSRGPYSVLLYHFVQVKQHVVKITIRHIEYLDIYIKYIKYRLFMKLKT